MVQKQGKKDLKQKKRMHTVEQTIGIREYEFF